MAITKKTKYSISLGLVVLALIGYSMFGGKEQVAIDKQAGYNPDSIPMMSTEDVNLLVSDSGIAKYRVIAASWQAFEKIKEPYWFFPRGLYVEEYDTLFTVISKIEADTAWNFKTKKEWELRGNVRIENQKGVVFKSEEFFWNENTQRVWSNKNVLIDEPGKLIVNAEGGFTAPQSMDEWTLLEITDKTKFYVTEKEDQSAPKDRIEKTE